MTARCFRSGLLVHAQRARGAGPSEHTGSASQPKSSATRVSRRQVRATYARPVTFQVLPLTVALALCAGCTSLPTEPTDASQPSTVLREVPLEALTPDV